MPKAGAKQPWRLTFQYDTQDKTSSRAHYSEDEARHQARQILEYAEQRGSTITTLTILNRDTGHTTDLLNQGETMADETTTVEAPAEDPHAATLDQITANIERATSLAEADNVDGIAELSDETETLISSLPTRGRHGDQTWAGYKKALRAAFREAATVQATAEVAKPEPVKVTAVPIKTWDEYDGVPELVALGAERTAEGVQAQRKTVDLAKDLAKITFDMWVRMPNKDGLPDLKGNSNASKEAARSMYAKAGEGWERSFENEDALTKLQRSVQAQRTDVRADWLKMLDEDTTDAADARALFGDRLDAKPDGVSVAEFVAGTLYNSPAMLVGETEKARERFALKQKAAEAGKELAASGGEGDGEGETEDETTADERVLALVVRLESDVQKLNPDDFPKLSDEAKEATRAKLEPLYKALKDAITATL